MARRSNYSFERRERERLTAEKKAKRAASKQDAREGDVDESKAPGESEETDTT